MTNFYASAGLVALLLAAPAAAFVPSSPRSSAPAAGRPAAAALAGASGDSDSYGASSTSFYTTAEKQSTYLSSDELLEAKCADPKVRRVINDMLDVCADITDALRTSLVTVEGTENEFGDSQLSVDVSGAAERFFRPRGVWTRVGRARRASLAGVRRWGRSVVRRGRGSCDASSVA